MTIRLACPRIIVLAGYSLDGFAMPMKGRANVHFITAPSTAARSIRASQSTLQITRLGPSNIANRMPEMLVNNSHLSGRVMPKGTSQRISVVQFFFVAVCSGAQEWVSQHALCRRRLPCTRWKLGK